jgi:hypothetical protein
MLVLNCGSRVRAGSESPGINTALWNLPKSTNTEDSEEEDDHVFLGAVMEIMMLMLLMLIVMVFAVLVNGTLKIDCIPPSQWEKVSIHMQIPSQMQMSIVGLKLLKCWSSLASLFSFVASVGR